MDVLERLERVVDGTVLFLLACGHLKEFHASLQLDVPCFPRLAHATCSPFAVWYHRYPPLSLTARALVVLFHLLVGIVCICLVRRHTLGCTASTM
jgi:hypothetical protein